MSGTSARLLRSIYEHLNFISRCKDPISIREQNRFQRSKRDAPAAFNPDAKDLDARVLEIVGRKTRNDDRNSSSSFSITDTFPARLHETHSVSDPHGEVVES